MVDYIPRRRPVGGVRIDGAKAASTSGPIRVMPVPATLFVPIDAGRGDRPSLVVREGEHVLRGQLLADGPSGSDTPSAHATSSGTVVALVEKLGVAGDELRRLLCVEIATDGRDTACSSEAPGSSAEDQVEAIRSAGIIGLGGAAFSTAAKIRGAQMCTTLIVNGAECEPYISCDDMLMREAAAEIAAGCIELLDIAGAEVCIVAVERDKPKAIESMRAAIEALGDPRIAVAEIPTIYPAGGERQLIELLTGIEVPSGRYPSDIGVLCQNVGTTLAIHRALQTGAPLIDRVVTVTGAGIASPGNVATRIGTPLGALVEFCGGYLQEAVHLVVGGSMMGVSLANDDAIVTKTTNCLVAASEREFPATERTWPCIRCGECALACPVRLQPQELHRAAQSSQMEALAALGLDDCISCGCCDVVCPSHIHLTSQFRMARAQLAEHRREAALTATAQSRFEARAARLRARDEAARTAQSELIAKVGDTQAARDEIAAAVARARRRKQTPDP
jgi:electron transport complex protein RnfC